MYQQHDPLVAKPGSSSSSSDDNFVVDAQPAGCTPLTDSMVIDSQFCTQNHQLKLALIKTDDKFVSVKNTEGDTVFRIEHEQALVHERRLLCDGFGNLIVILQRKKKSIHKTWKVYKGGNKHSKDLLFSARRSSSTDNFPTNLLDVFLETNPDMDVRDFTVIGSWMDGSYTFYATGTDSETIIAQMRKKQKGKESEMLGDEEYSTVTVYPKIDYAFVVALIVILYAIQDDDKPKQKDPTCKQDKLGKMSLAATLVVGTVAAARL